MKTRRCGRADLNLIYSHFKPLITINTSYPKEMLNILYYMF